MVSVVVPYVEDRGYLDQCLDSINQQKYPDIEIIQVKGPNPVAVNVNLGLQEARGEFFKVVGEDDWLPQNSISDLVEGMKEHAWVVANAINTDGKHESPEIPPLEKLNLVAMAHNNVIHNGTTMYRTEILREIGGMDETLWTAEEYEMHLRLMKRGLNPGYVDKFVYYYRVWGSQKSRLYRKQNKTKRDEEIKRIQSLYLD